MSLVAFVPCPTCGRLMARRHNMNGVTHECLRCPKPIPLCGPCIGAIGGAHGGPDAPYRPAEPGEACGAADHEDGGPDAYEALNAKDAYRVDGRPWPVDHFAGPQVMTQAERRAAKRAENDQRASIRRAKGGTR